VIGRVVDAKLHSGRWPIAVFSSIGTHCFDPSDIEEVEVIDADGPIARAASYQQGEDPRYAPQRRGAAKKKRRPLTHVPRMVPPKDKDGSR
jgi:hypothetical protein